MLWMMLLKDCLQSGHSALIFDHSRRQVKQNMWKQLCVNDLSSILHRQIEQLGSGELARDSSWFAVPASSVALSWGFSWIVPSVVLFGVSSGPFLAGFFRDLAPALALAGLDKVLAGLDEALAGFDEASAGFEEALVGL